LGEESISHHICCRDRGGVAPNVAVAPKVAPEAVHKVDKDDAVGPRADATESSGIKSGTHPSGQGPRAQSGLFEPTADWKERLARLDDDWLRQNAPTMAQWRQRRLQHETLTAAALAAIDAAATTAIDAAINATTNDGDKTTEQKEVGALNYTLEVYGVEMGSRLHSGDVTIDTKTTPCIVNRPCGSRHSVIPRRLHDAFVIKVSLFREPLWIALDTAHWYQERPMPTRCWLARELKEYKHFDEIRAEEIGGVITLNPNKDWAGEGHDGTYLPIP
jgi:hypothetical protein